MIESLQALATGDPWVLAAKASRIYLVLSAMIFMLVTSRRKVPRLLNLMAISIAVPALIFVLAPNQGAAPIPALSINFGTATILLWIAFRHPKYGLAATWRDDDTVDFVKRRTNGARS